MSDSDASDEHVLVEIGWTTAVVRGGRVPRFVPYRAEDHADGNHNHGYVDLKNNAHLVGEIPEAQAWPELAAILTYCNGPGPYMTTGCDTKVIPMEHATENHASLYILTYIDVAFAQSDYRTPERVRQFACDLANAVGDLSPWVRLFFGVVDATLWNSPANIIEIEFAGYGRSDDEAREIWAFGCDRVLGALRTCASNVT